MEQESQQQIGKLVEKDRHYADGGKKHSCNNTFSQFPHVLKFLLIKLIVKAVKTLEPDFV